MEPRPLLARRVVFFGGKGGVGKTTVASAFAVLSAERGDRTLLVSTDPAHSTSDMLETRLGPEATEVADRLWALEIDPAHETEAYIAHVKARIADSTPPRLAHEVERQIDIARLSPGAEEAALFDRFTRILEDRPVAYDRVIFDTAPTGHTLRLLSLPEAMAAWTGGLIARRHKVNALGRMWRRVAGAAAGEDRGGADPVLEALQERKRRFEHARRQLTDPAECAFAFVVIPERLPILETERAVRTLEKYRVPVGAVIVNRILPRAVDGAFLAQRRTREAGYLATIERTFRDHPIYRLELGPTDIVGQTGLRQIIDQLPRAERLP